MFERFFQRSDALARQRSGPLAEERHRYLLHCSEQQMVRATLLDIACYILQVAHSLRLADRPGELLCHAEIATAAETWASRRPRLQTPRQVSDSVLRFTGHATRWLDFMGRLLPPEFSMPPQADLAARFAEYLLRERGLSPRTVKLRCWAIHGFLHRIGEAGTPLEAVTAAEVDDVLISMVRDGGYARTTVHNCASSLRAFFRYAEQRGWCRAGLAASVMAPRLFPQENLPLGPSWDDVKRLLASADGSSPMNIRDRAMLMLLAIYGLRAGEVIRLRLEDFDWHDETLTVAQGKCPKARTYPLCRAVGDAVLRYLRQARPRSDRREVFLTLPARVGIIRGAALCRLCRHRHKRHSFAVNRLISWYHQGADVNRLLHHLSVYLGHGSLAATQVYLSMTPELLRQASARFERYACGENPDAQSQ